MIAKKEKILVLENFEGPLDLLLFMIRSKKMDIFAVSLIEVANQYVDFVYEQQIINLDLTSEYLLIASKLLDIKSKSLLKTELFSHDIFHEEETEDLLEKLIVYEKIKNLSVELSRIYEDAPRFEKLDDDFVPYVENEGEKLIELFSNGQKDLKKAMRNILANIETKNPTPTKIKVTRLSVKEITAEIHEKLNEGNTTFLTILSNNTYYYIALALLIILEMAKNNEIFLKQNEDYSDIEIRRVNEK